MKKQKMLRVVLVVLVCAVMVVPQVPVFACGPFFAEAVFSYTTQPDVPFDHYVSGELGVVQPSYRPVYLYVAYRYFNGQSLTHPEEEMTLALLNQRLSGEGMSSEQESKKSASEIWLTARGRVPGIPAIRGIRTDRRVEVATPYGMVYQTFTNCLDPAFVTAADTLNDRIQEFGADSPAAHEWVKAEDAVFDNCDDSREDAIDIPAAADAGLPEIIRADRAYQIAAAHFYAEDFDAADKLFAEIAQDSRSPWRATSALMVARTRIRAASLSAEKPEDKLKLLREAGETLEKILTDSSLAKVHDGAERLYGYVRYRTDAAGRTHELAAKMEKSGDANLGQDLDDYTGLLESERFYEDPGLTPQEMAKRAKAFSGDVRSDDVTDWILNLHEYDKDARAHAMERWHATLSNAWLIAALMRTQASDADAESLLAASRKIEVNSPVYITAAFHRVRIEMEAGRRDAARTELDALLVRSTDQLPRSALNLFLAARTSLARNLDELMRYAVRVPAAVEGDYGIPEATDEQMFDRDGALAFTREMPTSMLARAAEEKILPALLRVNVAESAWVRAVVIGDDANAMRLALDMGKIKPRNGRTPQVDIDVEPEVAATMKEYVEAPDRAARQFAAAEIILRMPGLRPFVAFGAARGDKVGEMDRFHDNWWCGMPAKEPGQTGDRQNPVSDSRAREAIAASTDASLEFLSASERKLAEEEWTKLVAAGGGPNWLGEQTIAFAKLHRADPRVPEALHLVVQATRYGCGDKQSSAQSHTAFDLLHRWYPNSEWTQKTPYWF
ncbi:MAG TPA: hypothetical protein VIH72_08480 [Candidatus Acidoferrales bacterium]